MTRTGTDAAGVLLSCSGQFRRLTAPDSYFFRRGGNPARSLLSTPQLDERLARTPKAERPSPHDFRSSRTPESSTAWAAPAIERLQSSCSTSGLAPADAIGRDNDLPWARFMCR